MSRRLFFIGIMTAIFVMPVFVMVSLTPAQGQNMQNSATDSDKEIILKPGETLPITRETLGDAVCGPIEFVPVFEEIGGKILCPSGTYLPANSRECVSCPADMCCDGGNFEFNPKSSQGIGECSPNPMTPTPPSPSAECSCDLLVHIGDDKLCLYREKLTSPSLVVNVGGRKWYGAMTPVSQGIKKISADAEISWHMVVDGTEYTVHDHTVAPELGCGCSTYLHIDKDKFCLHSEKSTSPSLVVYIDGKKWYGDMTPVSQGVKPISTGADISWHAVVDGTEYTVHGYVAE